MTLGVRFLLIVPGLLTAAFNTAAQESMPNNPTALFRQGAGQTEAKRIHDSIYQAIGFGNTYLVTTPDGAVVIDTSNAQIAPRHVKLLKSVSKAPVKYVILTHGHGDHTGGVELWREPGTQVIAQKNFEEMVHYQTRLGGFFGTRNAAQFALPTPPRTAWAGNFGAKVAPTVLFDQRHEFTLGGLKFEVAHTPGETPDHLTVFIPQLKAAFVGDNYYESFPNLYTLRGTKPRWALEYVSSLNKVLAFEPELLLPSHGPAITGAAEVRRRLTQYRDAILYVHDAVVRGMNDGKDVYALMREVKLPQQLEVGESYGKLSWSVRGIYEGYAGWFDLNPATMYETPSSAVHADLAKLAGGPDKIVERASERLQQGQIVEALHLIDVATAAEPAHRGALELRLRALAQLIARCRNTNERGWLDYSVAETKRKLAAIR